MVPLPQHITVYWHYPNYRKGLEQRGHMTAVTVTVFVWLGQRGSQRRCPYPEHARNVQGQSRLSFDGHSAGESRPTL